MVIVYNRSRTEVLDLTKVTNISLITPHGVDRVLNQYFTNKIYTHLITIFSYLTVVNK